MPDGVGTKAWKKRLLRVPEDIRRAVNKANAENAAEWVAAAQRLAPVDPVGGVHLRPSIRHYESETGGQIVKAGGKSTTKPSAGGPYDYAVGVEFGTIMMNAQPYFWPAYRALKKKFARRRRAAVRKALKDGGNGR